MTTMQECVDSQLRVRAWIELERNTYANVKYPPTKIDWTAEQGEEWVMQYVHRATVLGWDNPLGRQALAKALMTLTNLVELTVRRDGPLPVASGDIKEW